MFHHLHQTSFKILPIQFAHEYLQRHLSGITQLRVYYHGWDSLFNSAYCTFFFLQLIHFLQLFSTKIRVEHLFLVVSLMCSCMISYSKRILNHMITSCFLLMRRVTLQFSAVFTVISYMLYTGQPHPLSLTLLVKYDTTKTILKARPVMCLLHCMLTCRHSAAGTWLLTLHNTKVKTWCRLFPRFQTIETFQDRKLPSLSARGHVKTLGGKDRLYAGGSLTGPKNVRHAASYRRFLMLCRVKQVYQYCMYCDMSVICSWKAWKYIRNKNRASPLCYCI